MSDEAAAGSHPLAGRRVLVTRERPGQLGRRLAERGAEVVHVPLIAVEDADDGGRALRAALRRLADMDWLLVTSAAGAERVGEAASTSQVRLGAVGTVTARVLGDLAGRPVDAVPSRQVAEALADDILERAGASSQRILIAQADRASSVLADRLRAGGHQVTVVEAYRTVLVRPDASAIDGADALALASGSAAQSWATVFGSVTPDVVVAIGPTTADAARRLGLKVTAVAADHNIEGLVDAIEQCFGRRSSE